MQPVPLALVSYSAQILVVVCVAALASALCRLSSPAVRLAYWRGIGALCILLPLLARASAELPQVSIAFGTSALTGVAGEPASPVLTTLGTSVLWIWAAGALTRSGWLVIGAVRLRRLRRRSVAATLDADIGSLRAALAPRADFRWSPALTQPVTFGVRRPVILLPRALPDLSADARYAVACHELLHVARRDWIWIVVEEQVRALFWFHPGVWWLIDMIILLSGEFRDSDGRKIQDWAPSDFAQANHLSQEQVAQLQRDVERLQHELMDVHERIDFHERLLQQGRQ